MWKSYTEKGNGILIQSTFSCLKKALEPTEVPIYIGNVKYRNHLIDEANTSGIDYLRFFRKDLSFKYEKELRALAWFTGITDFDYNKKLPHNTYCIPINLDIFIEKIHLSPSTPEWKNEVIKSTLKKLHPSLEVNASQLKPEPIH